MCLFLFLSSFLNPQIPVKRKHKKPLLFSFLFIFINFFRQRQICISMIPILYWRSLSWLVSFRFHLILRFISCLHLLFFLHTHKLILKQEGSAVRFRLSCTKSSSGSILGNRIHQILSCCNYLIKKINTLDTLAIYPNIGLVGPDELWQHICSKHCVCNKIRHKIVRNWVTFCLFFCSIFVLSLFRQALILGWKAGLLKIHSGAPL